MKNFEEIIALDEELNNLLNKHTIYGITDFSKKEYSNDFKEYFQEKYFESYVSVLDDINKTKNKPQFFSIQRSIEFLATNSTEMLIKIELLKYLQMTDISLNNFITDFDTSGNYYKNTTRLKVAFNFIVFYLLNNYSNEADFKDYKESIISKCLHICDLTSVGKPKDDEYKYKIYNIVMNSLSEIDGFEVHEEKVKKHKRKIGVKRTGLEVKFWIGIIFSILLFIAKLLELFQD